MDKTEILTPDVIEQRLAAALAERKLPDYFLYVGESGTRNWLELDRSDDFAVARRLTGLLDDSLPRLAEALAKCEQLDVLSVGVGDGRKERLLLQALAEVGRLRYVAMDVSSQMIDEALRTVADIDVQKHGLVALCEDLPQLTPHWSSPLLLCLLGNNFCNYAPDALLGMLSHLLGAGDFLLFDCHIYPSSQLQDDEWRRDVARAYGSEANVRFNTWPLVTRGVKPEACRFSLELVRVPTACGPALRTSKHIEILEDAELRIGGKRSVLWKGDVIQMGFTYKYTAAQVEGYVARHGLQIARRFLSPDGENLMLLVTRKGGGS